MANTLVPEYLGIDYNTILADLKEQLQESTIFRDYDYQGSNIALLMELVAYIGELNTFMINRIARNVFDESADIYETVSPLARQKGYEPKGNVSGKATITVTISGSSIHGGDVLYIPAWHEIETDVSDDDGNTVYYSTTTSTSTTAAIDSYHSFDVDMMQGRVISLTDYKGKDLVSNELYLPFYDYSYDDDLDDSLVSIELSVNDEVWERISDFYDELSPLTEEDNVYMFVIDKYQRPKIVFSSTRNVPTTNDEISIKLLKSLGADGGAGANKITGKDNYFVKNLTTDAWINQNQITVTNAVASTNQADPETLSEIKENSKQILHTQYRNVTKADYVAYLEARSDVDAANSWGEQDVAPSGDVNLYNKVYLSVLPATWSTATISSSAADWILGSNTHEIIVPLAYSTTWTDTIKEYLEPRKILCTYEEFELPELTYFSFDIGIKIKRLYNFVDVYTDVKNKLIHYFRADNMDFHGTINFLDIIEYILDTTETSDSDDFPYIKGISSLVIRDIDCNRTIYEINTSDNWPQYTTSVTGSWDNQLRPIQVGHNQFPILAYDNLTFVEES